MLGFGSGFDFFVMQKDLEIEDVVEGVIACIENTGEVPEITAEEIYRAYGYEFDIEDVDEVCVRVQRRLM